MLDKEFETVPEGMEKLKNAVSIRNQMGGALYWNICQGDCEIIAKKLFNMGADESTVYSVIKS